MSKTAARRSASTPSRRQSRAGTPARTKAARASGRRPFSSVDDAVAAIRRGGMVIVVDDEDRENEGDLTIAASKITPAAVNFMMTHGRGFICLPMTGDRLDELEIPLQVPVGRNTSTFGTAFCIGIEARRGVTTGISAADRAKTIRTAIDPKTRPSDLARPGHVLPLRARDGGVLVRAGQTEAAVDLARAAGLYPAGVICEIAKADGSMARVPDLARFARKHRLPMITVADLIQYRMRTERLVTRAANAGLPTVHGDFRVYAYESPLDGETHVALVRGDLGNGENVLVRVHSKCLTGDVFHSARCDCGPQLDAAMQRIAAEGRGVLLYLNQEGRGIGLTNKIKAYALQDQGFDTVEANEHLGFKPDQRDYGIGAQVLRDLGVRTMRLLTNNPRKFVGLQGYGLAVVASVPLEIAPSDTTRRYLRTKKEKLGHRLTKV
jgi:3,4-dihydroxy 2-butanone 4-phosphate synthase / GTP cyclohydrolase II